MARGALGPGQRRARRLRPEAPYRDPGDDELVHGPRGWRQGRGVESGSRSERAFSLVEASDQEKTPGLEKPRVRGVHPVAVLVERRPRRVEHPRRPAQVARGERDLGFGDDTPRPGDGVFRVEGARRAPEERLRRREVAELRHGDAPKRQSRRIVAQGHPVQGAEGVTRGESPGSGRNHRIHRNPATLVTPVPSMSGTIISRDGTPARARSGLPQVA